MSSDKYFQALVKNVEADLEKKGIRLPSKCYTSMSRGCRPEMEYSPEVKTEGIRRYQEKSDYCGGSLRLVALISYKRH